MRNFVKIFLFLIFGTTFGIDGIFQNLKNANNETMLVIDCEGVVFSYLDAAFSEKYKDLWKDFSKKRSNLDREKNEMIDRALFFAPKKIMDMGNKQGFKDLLNKGVRIVFLYKINEDLLKFRNEWMIKSFFISLMGDLGLDPKMNSSVKLLITYPKSVSSSLATTIREFEESEEKSKSKKETDQKMKSIKNIFVIHDGNLTLDNNVINLPVESISIQPTDSEEKDITKSEILRQMEILEKTGEWMDDVRIRHIMTLSDDELVYEMCKQSIMDVCPCTEIIEDRIFDKIANIVKDKKALTNSREIIDDFQEIYYSLPSIFDYVVRVRFWESCLQLGVSEQKAVELLKKMKHFYFNEHEARGIAYKILRNIGCGIHWRDMAKYEFIQHFLMTNERMTAQETDSPRYKVYLKVLNEIFNRVGLSLNRTRENQRDELIRILHENKVEDAKIIKVFKISEEKFKNILSASCLKNEEVKIENEKNSKKI